MHAFLAAWANIAGVWTGVAANNTHHDQSSSSSSATRSTSASLKSYTAVTVLGGHPTTAIGYISSGQYYLSGVPQPLYWNTAQLLGSSSSRESVSPTTTSVASPSRKSPTTVAKTSDHTTTATQRTSTHSVAAAAASSKSAAASNAGKLPPAWTSGAARSRVSCLQGPFAVILRVMGCAF